jgi:hypothetical protein
MTKPVITKGHTVPQGENLRHAIRWLSEQCQSEQSHWTENRASRQASREAVEKAGLLFDLTPLEEEFLIRHFITQDNN